MARRTEAQHTSHCRVNICIFTLTVAPTSTQKVYIELLGTGQPPGLHKLTHFLHY